MRLFIYRIIKLVLFVSFSVLIFIFEEDLLAYLNYFISSLMIAYGVEEILLIGLINKKDCIKDTKFIFGFIELLIGLVIITSIYKFEIVCTLWATWALIREVFEIYEIINRKVTGVFALISGVESIVSIVFCVLLLINPSYHHARTHLYLLIVELILTALTPVLSSFTRKKKKEIDNC